MCVGSHRRQRLAREDQRHGPAAMFERDLPALRGFHRVRRAQHQHVGHGAQRCQDLHGLVRRPVFSDADRVVAEDELHRQPHQRRHAHGRALVVREGQIGQAQGDHPAMRRHAIGHGAHDMLAHAAVDVGAGAVVRRESPQAPLVAHGRFEVGAGHHALGQHLGEQSADLGRDGDASRRRRTPARGACIRAGLRASRPAARPPARAGTRPARGGRAAAGLPGLVLAPAAAPGVAPGAQHRLRHFEGPCGQPSRVRAASASSG